MLMVQRKAGHETRAIEFSCGSWKRTQLVFCEEEDLSSISDVRWDAEALVIIDSRKGERRISRLKLYQQMRAGIRGLEVDG
jgi:hypothetical protein